MIKRRNMTYRLFKPFKTVAIFCVGIINDSMTILMCKFIAPKSVVITSIYEVYEMLSKSCNLFRIAGNGTYFTKLRKILSTYKRYKGLLDKAYDIYKRFNVCCYELICIHTDRVRDFKITHNSKF